jgi:transposase
MRNTNVSDIREVIRYLRAGESIRGTAKALKLDRKTVRRYDGIAKQAGWLSGEMPSDEVIAHAVQKQGNRIPEQNRPSMAAYDAEIRAWMAQGLEAKAIYDRLSVDPAFDRSYHAVWRYVCKVRGVTANDVVMRIETDPGDEAQVDFGFAGRMWDRATQKVRRAWFFVMTLSWSRHQYVRFVFDQKVATWLDCHRRAFESFGGVPGRIVPDNLKAAILKATVDDPQVQRAYRECAEHYGFMIAPCKPRKPEHKGKVERGVQYVKGSFLRGRPYADAQHDIQLANDDVTVWVNTIAGQRIHGTTRQKPLQRFTEGERYALRPLPDQPYEVACFKQTKLGRDSHIVWDHAHYSAPYRLLGQELLIRATVRTVEIYAEHVRVATHSRAGQVGQWVTDKSHLPEHKNKAVASLFATKSETRQRVAQIGPYTAQAIGILLDDTVVDRRRTVGRLISLADRHSQQLLERACQAACEAGDPSPTMIRAMLKLCVSGTLDETTLLAAPMDQPARPTPRFARPAAELVPYALLPTGMPLVTAMPAAPMAGSL